MKSWTPSKMTIENSNIFRVMSELKIDSYDEFWKWSVRNKAAFWTKTVKSLGLVFDKKYSQIFDISNGVENAQWLSGAKLNIIDSCFQNSSESTAILIDNGENENVKISQSQLEVIVNSIANGFVESKLVPGDTIAIYMSMTLEAVAIYLAAIKAGIIVATIADSFSSDEILMRLKITQPKLIFTQDGFLRSGRTHRLYDTCRNIYNVKQVVVNYLDDKISLAKKDMLFENFRSSNTVFTSVKVDPSHLITILFSSGTTGEPKAIPWDHSTPVKSASDAFYHHDIKNGDVVCWPTNLGWMMGPWLVFAALINKATIALYSGSPLDSHFGAFVSRSKVTMLGVVPSIVSAWKLSQSMEQFDWSAIRNFSSTGEVSNPNDMTYLMGLAGNKPIIEYCGGTEIGGGYIASTLVQENFPSQFSSPTLGGEFVLLNEEGMQCAKGQVFLIPPIMGLSTKLINRNHHEVYYKGISKFNNQVLRKHGDELHQLENNYFKVNGRTDDTMNLGGIKVSSVQIEVVVNTLEFISESAAVAVSKTNGGPSELVIYFVAFYAIPYSEALEKVKNCVKTKLNPLFKVMNLVKIDNLPRTASKKIKRKELRTLYVKQQIENEGNIL